ncbi:MAG TPA: hypothetical protein VJ385_18200 [Fibrobacteria bacterium]|nr:hypothetical protein [Fibrobacteria bacterium]
MALIPKPFRALWILAALSILPAGFARAGDGKTDTPAAPKPAPGAVDHAPPKVRPRSFRTFLPKPGETIDDPSSQVVQVLLDRQDKGEYESYMVQVLFRGKPSDRAVRMLSDRVEIDFLDTGKPSMRLSKIRGGAVEASSVDEFYYKDGNAKAGVAGPARIKRMVRLTLFMHEKADLRFRDTLDRTLIHFRLPKHAAHKG